MFTLSNLPKSVHQRKKIIGRGNGSHRGKNSGHGNKGQVKRAGKMRIGFEGGQQSLIARSPKIRGYKFTPNTRGLAVVTTSMISNGYENGEVVSLLTLKAKQLVDEKIKRVRIIKNGDLSKKLTFEEDVYLTKGVKEMV